MNLRAEMDEIENRKEIESIKQVCFEKQIDKPLARLAKK